MQTRIGTIYEKLSARGIPSYSLELWHDGLNKHRVIRGESVAIVRMKASLQADEWDERWELVEERRQQKNSKEARKLLLEENKSIAAERTLEAQQEFEGLSGILKATLDVDDAIDWDSIKDKSPFPEPKPTLPKLPAEPKMAQLPPEPIRQDSKYIPKIGILEWLIPSRKVRAV